jgi:hypothetical protein
MSVTATRAQQGDVGQLMLDPILAFNDLMLSLRKGRPLSLKLGTHAAHSRVTAC